LSVIVKDICSLEVAPLEEASEKSFHFGTKSPFFLFLLHDLVYVWYFSANLGISLLQVVLDPFLGMEHHGIVFQVTKIWGIS
jgi:hypothetical protein